MKPQALLAASALSLSLFFSVLAAPAGAEPPATQDAKPASTLTTRDATAPASLLVAQNQQPPEPNPNSNPNPNPNQKPPVQRSPSDLPVPETSPQSGRPAPQSAAACQPCNPCCRVRCCRPLFFFFRCR